MDAENVAVEEAPPAAGTGIEPSFEFDGCRFGVSFWGAAPLLYLAKKARDGDADAAALLNGFTIKLTDADGNLYWPLA
jgi:hypothetical protein